MKVQGKRFCIEGYGLWELVAMHLNKIIDNFDLFSSTSDVEGFRVAMAKNIKSLGFESWSVTDVRDGMQSGRPSFLNISEIPKAYESYFYDADGAPGDPVMAHAKNSSLPLVWNFETYALVQREKDWEILAQFGLVSGIIGAMHLPFGRHFVLGVETPDQILRDPKRLALCVGQFQLMLVSANVTCNNANIFNASGPDLDGQPLALSARELECLTWTGKGKTAWEVGAILSIAERTVIKHLDNAIKKLGVANKLHAVVLAMQRGLIFP